MILGLSYGGEAGRGCLVGTLLCSIEGSSVRGAWERCTAKSGDISVLTLHGQSSPTKPHLEDVLPPLNSLCSDDRKYVCH